MYYCQLIFSICDYSFSDSETFTFIMPKEKQSTFISDYNKAVEKKHDTLKALERAGGLDLPKNYGLIKSYQRDDQTIEFGDFKESEAGLYLLSESYESFSNSYMTEKLCHIAIPLTKSYLEELLVCYNKDLSELKKEVEKENENWLKAFRSSDVEKKIKKALCSLKGKDKKESNSFEENLRKKLNTKEEIKRNKARELLTKKVKEKDSLIKSGFIGYVLKKSEGSEIEFDFVYESNDESGKIT